MPRRNVFDRPQDPVAQIEVARERKRERAWEQSHRGRTWYIPPALQEQAKETRAEILALAQKHMATASNVASALLDFSLAQVRSGKLQLETRPDPGRRKLPLAWEEASDWAQEIQPPRRRTANVPLLRLTYRIDGNVVNQIQAAARTHGTTDGEVAVRLLRHALDAYKSGRLRLREEAVVMGQKVSSTWR